MAADVEGPIHRAVLGYLRATLPAGFLVMHVANKPRSAAQGIREKRMGAIAGWPDLGIYGPAEAGATAWFMEIKPPRVTVPQHQRELHDRLMDAGFAVRVVRSVDDARRAVHDWSLPSRDMLIRDCGGASA